MRTTTRSALPPSAVRATAASVVGMLAVAIVSSTPNSPYYPILPVGLVAVVAAAVGFILILREAWHGRVSVRMVVLIAVVFHLIVLTLPLLFSRDVYSYAYYGRIWNSYGANPYVATPSHFRLNAMFGFTWPGWRGTPSVYGPLFTWVSVVTTGLLRSVTSQIRGFQILAAMASLGTLFVEWRLVKRVRPERA